VKWIDYNRGGRPVLVGVCGGLVLCLAVGCQTPPVSRPADPFFSGEFQRAMAEQQRAAQSQPVNKALALANFASAALAAGEYGQASSALQDATNIMLDFKPDGEYRALIGAEEEKNFKGWPYEKAMAFSYLGMLDLMDWEVENALASFKNAVLADAGTRDEKFRADFIWAYLMMARTYSALGEDTEAAECTASAVRAVRTRQNASVVSSSIQTALRVLGQRATQKDKRELLLAADVLYEQLYLGQGNAETPRGALGEAVGQSLMVLKGDWSPQNTQASAVSAEAVRDAVTRLGAEAEGVLAKVPQKAYRNRIEAVCHAFGQLSDPKRNVLVVFDLGRGPRKFRYGDKGHLVKVARSTYYECSAAIDVAGTFTESTKVEDTYFQASTLGGRAMDAVLGRKAYYKDTLETVGSLAYMVGGNYGLLPFLLLTGASSRIDAEADTRFWEYLPGQVHMAALKLPEGEYRVVAQFYDATGNELGQLRVERQHAIVHPSPRITIWYFRAGGR